MIEILLIAYIFFLTKLYPIMGGMAVFFGLIAAIAYIVLKADKRGVFNG